MVTNHLFVIAAFFYFYLKKTYKLSRFYPDSMGSHYVVKLTDYNWQLPEMAQGNLCSNNPSSLLAIAITWLLRNVDFHWSACMVLLHHQFGLIHGHSRETLHSGITPPVISSPLILSSWKPLLVVFCSQRTDPAFKAQVWYRIKFHMLEGFCDPCRQNQICFQEEYVKGRTLCLNPLMVD